MATQTYTEQQYTAIRKTSSTMLKVQSSLRILLGLIFFVMGLNGFFQFFSMPAMPSEAGNFMQALAATGYFFPFLKVIEVLSGLALLVNRFAHIAAVVLLPITVNIFLFHAFLAPGGLPLAILVLALDVGLIYMYFDILKPLLSAKID